MKEIKHLLTTQGESIKGNEYDLYPRPQLKRDSFLSLNGRWTLCACGEEREILVPYPPESILSGVNRVFPDGTPLTYQKSFTLPDGFKRDRVIINFGAVDGSCDLYVNGKMVGFNVGGYYSFSFDITDYLKEGENQLTLKVVDSQRGQAMPYGKQCFKRGGMWYTPVSGIWQSVWLESVPSKYMNGLFIDTGLDFCDILVRGVECGTLTLLENGRTYPVESGKCHIDIENPKLWSPESPYLYHFILECGQDKIESYFALRTLTVKEVDGIQRLCLNDKPYFFHGVLDQGYFSDGIYTPATPDLYRQDVAKMKELGFNTLRKHIKIEPEWFYYECDRQGMIVFQDMVNNGKYSFFHDTALPTIGLKNLPEVKRTESQKKYFKHFMKRTVTQLYNHPSICYWTIFNEGWGQFESDKMYDTLLEQDTSRFVDTNSGWFGRHKTQVESLHVYFKPVKLKGKYDKPVVLSEFGGYSYKEENHVANVKDTYGYRFFKERDKLEDAFVELYEKEIIPLIKEGLCGAIYTQLSDVEDETNGILTYDRRVCKLSKERLIEIAEKLKI
ncbi:MAG: glycoside hydrolase family 2 [Clostridia bacterium]|nr:glycoside hydrolase family 2 [Clostridia bacterium]MBQ7907814.1 glycoside hydrolase family 2 [Clostridia bacterium]